MPMIALACPMHLRIEIVKPLHPVLAMVLPAGDLLTDIIFDFRRLLADDLAARRDAPREAGPPRHYAHPLRNALRRLRREMAARTA